MNEAERRRYLRIKTTLDVEFQRVPPPRRAHVSDISEGGAFIETDSPYSAESLIDFRLDLPGGEPPVEGKAKVVWSQRSLGMGIEFLGLDRADRDRIRYYLARDEAATGG